MKVLQSWLRDYLKFSIPPEELVERLTMTGLEFESVEYPGRRYEGFVIGKVLEREKHPNADRLSVCRVDVGKETLQIVCGAPNVAPGQKVPVGLVGATVPRNQHDPSGAPFVLSRVSIRGIESSGMICSEAELDLGTDAAGIMVLDGGAKVGQPLARYLGLDDVVYNVEITPNRPDWLSHIGVAREIGVLTGTLPRLPRVRLKEGSTPIGRFLKVQVKDRENCPRFAARVIRGVRLGPSPDWLQQRLLNVGLRPRNNVVDVTNYVMMECGQPLHAFDYALLHGKTIVVRQAAEGTYFRTLDDKGHDLPAGTVMVCDAEREVSIAGVMGGANSEINDQTVDVVLESAYWKPSSIRRTAKALGISSDASQRFERGVDPNGIRWALDRAAALILEVAGGTLLHGAIDVYPKKIANRVVALRPDRVNAVLGTSLSPAAMIKFLRLLDIRPVRRGKGSVTFSIPTYRVDIEQEIDLIEEIARVYGYVNIEAKTHASVDFSQPFDRATTADRVRSQMIGQGFHDVITNPMQDEQRSVAPGITPVRILNPLSKDMDVMRSSLIPGLLQVAGVNQNRGNADLRLFEIGRVFRKDSTSPGRLVGDYVEEERLGILITGAREPMHWDGPQTRVDIFDMKGELQNLLEALGLDNSRFISYPTSDGLMESALGIEIQGSYAGLLGQISGQVLSHYGVEGEVFAAEVSLNSLQRGARQPYVPLPRFPRVRRDVAFVLDQNINAATVEGAIRTVGGELLTDVEVFDVYQGKGLPEGKKSLAFALELMSREKTLTDQEIDAVITRVVKHIESTCSATLRGV